MESLLERLALDLWSLECPTSAFPLRLSSAWALPWIDLGIDLVLLSNVRAWRAYDGSDCPVWMLIWSLLALQ